MSRGPNGFRLNCANGFRPCSRIRKASERSLSLNTTRPPRCTMFRLRSAFAITTLVLATSVVSAAPRPDDKTGGPAIIGQGKSLNELLDLAKSIVKNVGGDAIYKEFEKHVLPELDPKKLPGIDPKRPFGL